MNFKELMARMTELDQPIGEQNPVDLTNTEYKQGGAPQQDEGNKITGVLADKDTPVGAPIPGTDLTKTKQLEDELQQEMGCGMSMPSMNKQQDNVSMNVSMNGAGTGGIRDLMNILKNIEKDTDSSDHDHDMPGMLVHKKDPVLGDEYVNSPDAQVAQGNFPVDHGDDLHKSKNSYSDKPYRGDNPMALESYKAKLHTMYEDIKNRS